MTNTILLFAVYTAKHGYHHFACEPFKDGKNAFEQAIAYVQTDYNDPADKPRLYLLSEIPMN